MWNAKVIFKEKDLWDYKNNKIYIIKDGRIINDFGHESTTIFENIEQLNSASKEHKFELVSEELPQPHKSLLKSDYKVVYKNGNVRIVLMKTNSLHNEYGEWACYISDFNSDLVCPLNGNRDIMEIYNENNKLIAKRTEKSPQQLEIELIESEIKRETEEHNNKMKKLADRLGELGKEIMG